MMLVKIDDNVPDVEQVLIYLDDTHSSYMETKDGVVFEIVGVSSIQVQSTPEGLRITMGQ